MPTKQGEFCLRCAKQCVTREDTTSQPGKKLLIYECPYGHGTQHIEELPVDASVPVIDNTLPPEERFLNMEMNDSTDDIVALGNASARATAGISLQIDYELMTVVDASDLSNLKVLRGQGETAVEVHEVGAQVLIGVELPTAAS